MSVLPGRPAPAPSSAATSSGWAAAWTGTDPLEITGATIATSTGGAAIREETLRHLTVDGAPRFTIPAGAEHASDPMPFRSAGLEPVTVTLYLAEPTGPATYHAQALATSYRSEGDHRADAGAEAFTETSQSWYYLSGGGRARRPGTASRRRALWRLPYRRHG